MHDTWAVRDLPVLDATVALLEQSFMVTVTDIAARTGFEPSVVAAALAALDPVYVDFRKTTTGGDPRFWYVFKVTPAARRVTGQWPTAEALATRLAGELAAAAREEPDAERQGLLTYAARLVGDTLREATVRAAARVLAPAFDGVPVPELGTPMPEPEPAPADDYPSLVELPALPELLRSRQAVASPAPGEAPVPPAQQLIPLPEPDPPDRADPVSAPGPPVSGPPAAEDPRSVPAADDVAAQ